MKNMLGISIAFGWFALCVVAALFLLIAAFIYSGILAFRRASVARKIELPGIQIAR